MYQQQCNCRLGAVVQQQPKACTTAQSQQNSSQPQQRCRIYCVKNDAAVYLCWLVRPACRQMIGKGFHVTPCSRRNLKQVRRILCASTEPLPKLRRNKAPVAQRRRVVSGWRLAISRCHGCCRRSTRRFRRVKRRRAQETASPRKYTPSSDDTSESAPHSEVTTLEGPPDVWNVESGEWRVERCVLQVGHLGGAMCVRLARACRF